MKTLFIALIFTLGCGRVESSTEPPDTTSTTPTITPGCGSCLSTPCHTAFCFASGCKVETAADGTPCGDGFVCKAGKCEAS